MSKRVCDSYGKTKELSGAKTCETGHFICSSCVNDVGFFERSTQAMSYVQEAVAMIA